MYALYRESRLTCFPPSLLRRWRVAGSPARDKVQKMHIYCIWAFEWKHFHTSFHLVHLSCGYPVDHGFFQSLDSSWQRLRLWRRAGHLPSSSSTHWACAKMNPVTFEPLFILFNAHQRCQKVSVWHCIRWWELSSFNPHTVETYSNPIAPPDQELPGASAADSKKYENSSTYWTNLAIVCTRHDWSISLQSKADQRWLSTAFDDTSTICSWQCLREQRIYNYKHVREKARKLLRTQLES